jgi:hypothetical protein
MTNEQDRIAVDFNTQQDTFVVSVSAYITPMTVSDIMITAIEGGCDYWIDGFSVRGQARGAYQKPSSFKGDWIVDIETYEDGPATITKAALQKAMHDNPDRTLQIVDGSYDAETVDVLLQCAAFGEIVYG